MSRNHQTEIKKCQCVWCSKITRRVYNFTLQKWARAFKCKCGSESFQWFNW